jgi:hypothetical protein
LVAVSPTPDKPHPQHRRPQLGHLEYLPGLGSLLVRKFKPLARLHLSPHRPV